MASDTLHIVTHEDGWAIKREGEDSPESTHGTQKEAINHAVENEEDASHVVVHRRDGRIREVRTLEDETSNNGASPNGTEKQATDDRAVGSQQRVVTQTGSVPVGYGSLGSRVRWGAILSGFFVTIASSVTLSSLGLALGICLANVLTAEYTSLFMGTWIVLTLLASIFLGGLIISRLTVGEDNCLEPTVYGVILWALFFVVTPLLPMSSMDVGLGVANASASAPAMTAEQLEEVGLTAEQASTVSEMSIVDQGPAITYDGAATEIAWLTFAALVLSLGAAVFGAYIGSTIDETEVITA